MWITRSSICKHSQSGRALLEWGKSYRLGAIIFANEVDVELPDGMHNLGKELPIHPETAPKYLLAVQWIIDEVVDVQNAVTLHPLPTLALTEGFFLAACRRRGEGWCRWRHGSEKKIEEGWIWMGNMRCLADRAGPCDLFLPPVPPIEPRYDGSGLKTLDNFLTKSDENRHPEGTWEKKLPPTMGLGLSGANWRSSSKTKSLQPMVAGKSRSSYTPQYAGVPTRHTPSQRKWAGPHGQILLISFFCFLITRQCVYISKKRKIIVIKNIYICKTFILVELFSHMKNYVIWMNITNMKFYVTWTII